MLRLGLCCGFIHEEIKFRAATARYVLSLSDSEREKYIDQIAVDNANALIAAINWCADHQVGAFRINSGILPLYTHPDAGYTIDDLPRATVVTTLFQKAGEIARKRCVRLSFHPDQFVVPGSTSASVRCASLQELEYQARVGQLVGVEQMTLHGGGAYGDKNASLKRLADALEELSESARALVALENDDRVFTVKDLLQIHESIGIRLIYDVHHHRCNPDGLSVAEATMACTRTWKRREPWLHISSPVNGWSGKDTRSHADYVNPADIPEEWLDLKATVDIEAKAKERAVLRLQKWLKKRAAIPAGRT